MTSQSSADYLILITWARRTRKESIWLLQQSDFAARLSYFFVDFPLKYKLVLCSVEEVSNWKLIVAEQTSVDGTEI